MLACESVGIEPDCKMYLQGVVGDFGSRTSREEAPAVPEGRISSRRNRPEIFPGLVREQEQAFAPRIVSHHTTVCAACGPLLEVKPCLRDSDSIVSQ
jgi:hypothetical protein